MHTRFIESTQHPIAKHFTKLVHDKKYRYESKRVVVSCDKVIAEISKQVAPITVLEGSAEVLKKITKLPTFTGMLAEFEMPLIEKFRDANRLLILDGISDPGNLGTLIRTAAALGFDAIYLLPSCVDPFNDKALRSARAAPFFTKIYQGTYEEIADWKKRRNAPLYIATLEGKPLETFSFTAPLSLALGNESRGISKELQEMGTPVSIPMHAHIESFNVAVAGAIMMYAMR